MGHKWMIAALLALGVALPDPGLAQNSFADFSAKRVKPPKPGAKRRIMVQVAPRANPAVPPPPVNAPTPVVAAPPVADTVADTRQPPVGAHAWFWDHVSPALSDSGPGRLESALLGLNKAPAGQGVAAPRLQDLQNIAQRFGTDILLASVGTQVSPALALAVISVESAGRTDAISHAGASGLMQLMPATAERFGVTDRSNPSDNIKGGIAFLDFLMTKFDGDPVLVLAGYNAGENAVTRAGGVPAYAETRDYVPKVLAAFQTARGLCLTPPQLVSDGCVFRVSGNN